MILYFIRHGQSTNNALYDATSSDLNRVTDPDLTPLGVQQAARVANALCCGQPLIEARLAQPAGFGVTHLYCSLMLRAVHTGQIISQSLGLPLQGWTDLHEGGGIFSEDPVTGALTGLPGGTRAELTGLFPALVWPDDAPPDGWWQNRPFEPYPDRSLRARRVLSTLLTRHGDTQDRVVVVAHGGFFERFMCAAFGLPEDPRNLWFHMYNTAITCLEFAPRHTTGLHYLNRIDHLRPEEIT